MLWLLLLTLSCLGGSIPMTPDLRPGRELVGIIGGCPVSSRRFPWQVSLQFYNQHIRQWEHVCGGSLIHPQWVLTAAHCLELPEELEACAFRIQVGQLRLYEDDLLMKVAEIIRHPKYNESLFAKGSGDIALLRLEAPVALSEHVHPISFPKASLRVSREKTCWVTGWGTSELEGNSGGPLVCTWNCTWLQVGVVSWGDICGHRVLPGVHTSVMSYVSWIHHYVPQFPGPYVGLRWDPPNGRDPLIFLDISRAFPIPASLLKALRLSPPPQPPACSLIPFLPSRERQGRS
ncbi:LOW QUALITY PROTEIN: mastin-like [Erethizon dorsatum]